MVEPVMQFGSSAYSLAGIQLFRDLAAENQERIASILDACAVVKVAEGQVVLDPHNAGSKFLIVLSGSLGVTKSEHNLLENAVTRYLPGESVGEISVLDEEIHSSTITALQDSELLEIEAPVLWRLIDESNGVAKNLLRQLAFRIRAANAQIRNRRKVGEFYRQLSMVDGLTGLHNRAWLNNQLPMLVENALASETPLSILMVDLDHFKRFNDTYGHLLGDDALQAAAKVLNAGLRPSDYAARYGGEEMMVILPNTPLTGALGVAERLCTRIANTRVFSDLNNPLPHITASFGLASLEKDQDCPALIRAADAALYRAKEIGRNCVSI